MWNPFNRPVRPWGVYDGAAPLSALKCLGFVEARSRGEAKRQAREKWPSLAVVVEPVEARNIAAVREAIQRRA